jgi:hypothetical protein
MSPERAPNLSVQPMSPAEVTQYQLENFPAEVIDTVNMLIAESFLNGRAVVQQEDLVRILKEKGLDGGEIYKKGWLNIEEMYRASGWKVTYEKPGFNETGRSYFVFEVKNNS